MDGRAARNRLVARKALAIACIIVLVAALFLSLTHALDWLTFWIVAIVAAVIAWALKKTPR